MSADRTKELERENAELRRENAGLVRRIDDLCAEIGALKEKVEEQGKVIEEWKRGHRYRGKRRRKRKTQGEGKPPGRKKGHKGAGRSAPDNIDKTEHRTVDACPGCTGDVEDTGRTREQTYEDIIPARKVTIRQVLHEYRCNCCDNLFWSKLPPELGPNPKTGPEVQALITQLRGEYGLPIRKIDRMLNGLFGFDLSPGGIVQMLHRSAAQMRPGYVEVVDAARHALWLGADETGWRQKGLKFWLWVFSTPDLAVFHIDQSRGRKVVQAMLGERFNGILVSDFYSAYVGYPVKGHQFCWPHLLREADRVADIEACEQAMRFSRELREAFVWAAQASETQEPLFAEESRLYLHDVMADTTMGEISGVARLQARIGRHFESMLTATTTPGVPLDNNGRERDLRPMIIFRKTSFGTQSPKGSETLSILGSVNLTIHKRGGSLGQYLLEAKKAYYADCAPPSLLGMFPPVQARPPT